METLCVRCGKEPPSGIQPRGQIGQSPLCLTCRNQEMAYRVGGRHARLGRLRVPPSGYRGVIAEAWLQGYDAGDPHPMTPTERAALNARLAEQFGWRHAADTYSGWIEPGTGQVLDLPDYLTWEGMGEVLGEMVKRGYSYALYETPGHSSVLRLPTAAFVKGVHPPQMYGDCAREAYVEDGDTLPLAVAACALAALEGE